MPPRQPAELEQWQLVDLDDQKESLLSGQPFNCSCQILRMSGMCLSSL
jgi:hypothetical protein